MHNLKKYILITFGVLLVAISLEYFFYPNNIASGGVSGIALILNKLFNIPASLSMIVFNIILFVIAFIFLGSNYGIKSLYSATVLSIFMGIIEDVIIPIQITNDLIMATIFGSAILALGTALVFYAGASTGGTSIIANIISKYINLDMGKSLLISDLLVIIFAIYSFGIGLGLYGLLSIYLIGMLIDRFIDGFNLCKQVFIFTSKEQLVVDYIMKDVARGCTIFEGRGGYTGKNNTVIFTVLDRRQFIKLKAFMKKIDPKAFITTNEVTEVLGNGFKKIQ